MLLSVVALCFAAAECRTELLPPPAAYKHWPRQPAQAEAAVSTTVLTEADSQAEQARLDVSQSADAALPLRPNSTNNISVYCVQKNISAITVARLRPPNKV